MGVRAGVNKSQKHVLFPKPGTLSHGRRRPVGRGVLLSRLLRLLAHLPLLWDGRAAGPCVHGERTRTQGNGQGRPSSPAAEESIWRKGDLSRGLSLGKDRSHFRDDFHPYVDSVPIWLGLPEGSGEEPRLPHAPAPVLPRPPPCWPRPSPLPLFIHHAPS